MKYFKQCRLQRETSQDVAWIAERGAIVGASVELLPNDGEGTWTVLEVYNTRLTEDEVKEQKDKHRNAFASIST